MSDRMTNQQKELQNKEALLRGIEKLDFFNTAEKNKETAAPATNKAPSNILQSEFGSDPKKSMLAYLNSPGYKALKSRVMKDIIELDSMKQEQQFAARQKALKSRIMLLMLLSLYLSKAKAKSELNVKILEQLQDTFRKQKEQAKRAQQSTPLEVSNYEGAIAPLVDKLVGLESRITELDTKISLIEKETVEVREDAKHREAVLIDLAAFTAEVLEVIKNDEITRQSTLPVKKPAEVQFVGLLEQMLLEKKGEKVYFTADGKPTDSIMMATFIIPASKTLHKEGDTYILLNKGELLTEASRFAGKNDFESQKSTLKAPIAALRDNTKETIQKLDMEKTTALNEKQQCIAERQQIQANLEKIAETFKITPINLTPIPNAVNNNAKEEVAEVSSKKEISPKTTIEIDPQKHQESLQQLEQNKANPQNDVTQLPKAQQDIAERLSPLQNTGRNTLPKAYPKPALDSTKKTSTPEQTVQTQPQKKEGDSHSTQSKPPSSRG